MSFLQTEKLLVQKENLFFFDFSADTKKFLRGNVTYMLNLKKVKPLQIENRYFKKDFFHLIP